MSIIGIILDTILTVNFLILSDVTLNDGEEGETLDEEEEEEEDDDFTDDEAMTGFMTPALHFDTSEAPPIPPTNTQPGARAAANTSSSGTGMGTGVGAGAGVGANSGSNTENDKLIKFLTLQADEAKKLAAEKDRRLDEMMAEMAEQNKLLKVNINININDCKHFTPNIPGPPPAANSDTDPDTAGQNEGDHGAGYAGPIMVDYRPGGAA